MAAKEKEKSIRKERLDVLLCERNFFPSREKARAHIMAGEIFVAGAPSTKAGAKVPVDTGIEIKGAGDRYAGRGGEKLEGALRDFALDVTGAYALDVGASTGGFTDCLLQHGASHVHALDVGYGQLAQRMRDDPRVTAHERTNARYIEPHVFPRKFDVITMDVSFISIEKIFPALIPLLEISGCIVSLVKPQFEAGPRKIQRGGVVRDPSVHLEVLAHVAEAARARGLSPVAATYSPLKGPAGNIEFFMRLRHAAEAAAERDISHSDFEALVSKARECLNKV